MKKILCLAALVAVATIADAAGNISYNASAPCGKFDKIEVDASTGDLVVTCAAPTTTPAPTPTPTPTPPPPTPPPPPVTGCGPLPPNVVMVTPTTRSAAKEIVDRSGGAKATIYSFSLSALPPPSNSISTTRQPATPPSMPMRISISKCPGDFTYAFTSAASYRYPWETPTMNSFYPCDGSGNAESAGTHWGDTVGQNTCQVDTMQTWYVNMSVAYPDGTPYMQPDGVTPFCPPAPNGCPFIFTWN